MANVARRDAPRLTVLLSIPLHLMPEGLGASAARIGGRGLADLVVRRPGVVLSPNTTV